jgi:hypothetical protein
MTRPGESLARQNLGIECGAPVAAPAPRLTAQAPPRNWRTVSMNFATDIGFDR